MATLQELEQALAAADAAGDAEGAAHLAGVIQRAMQDRANLIPGTHIPETLQTQAEPTISERAVGTGEAALTLGTGATGGALGMLGGTLKGLAEQILSGQFGTPEAARTVEEAASKGAEALTYAPRTPAGQEQVRAVGEVLAQVPPVLPAAPAMAPAIASAKVAQPARAAVGAAKEVAQTITTISKERPGILASVGAAATPDTLRRVTVAEQMSVPFEGRSGLTAGQASRDFAQLQFEKESAKLGEVGTQLRERMQNQTATLIQNFDAMVDKAGPIAVERRDIGKAVSQAVVNKANVLKRKINDAYAKAREDGAMKEPVQLEPVANVLADLERYEGLSPMIKAVRAEAQRIGAVLRDERQPGAPIRAGTIPLEGTEQLRQFANDATNWTDRRDALFAKRIVGAIDDATEGKGGELYQQARKMRRQFAEEFENVGLTEKLLGTKRGTSERQIAFEDVFDKIVLLSSVDEMNKLRGTLLTAGKEGKQAWADLKSAGVEHIKESSLSPSARDAAGQPLLSPDKLNRVVKSLDKDGKLDALYGKKQAQQLRDLAELSSVIYTAPPGAINTSNTASALMTAIDGLGGFITTGLPIPVITSLRAVNKYVKNRKMRARIDEALKPQGAGESPAAPVARAAPALVPDISSKISNPASVAHGGRQSKPDELKTIYHATSVDAARKILTDGIKPAFNVSRELANDVYGNTDGGEFAYFGLNKEAALDSALSNDVVFVINAEKHGARAIVQPDIEGGIAMVADTIPSGAIVDVIINNPSSAAYEIAYALKKKIKKE